MPKKALIILHKGFEEIEAISPIDILRRAGVEVTVASREDTLLVEGKSSIQLQAESLLDAVLEKTFDGIILPGGPGTKRMVTDECILELVRNQAATERWIGAICAAPLVLKAAGVLNDHRYTAHVSTQEELPHRVTRQRVVIDFPFITSPGAGTAIPFALALTTALAGQATAREVAMAIGWYESNTFETSRAMAEY